MKHPMALKSLRDLVCITAVIFLLSQLYLVQINIVIVKVGCDLN